MEPIWAVGLMTGTVLDGNIDVALIKTDGERIAEFGAYTLAPYPAIDPHLLEETLRQARAWNFAGPEPAIFAEAEEALTRAQSAAVQGPGRKRRPDHGRYRRRRLPRPDRAAPRPAAGPARRTPASSAMAS